jgi:hypothetical protein
MKNQVKNANGKWKMMKYKHVPLEFPGELIEDHGGTQKKLFPQSPMDEA